MPDAGCERRLAVAFAFFDVGAPKASQDRAVGFNALPSEDGADLELLRNVRVERPAFELAAIQPQNGREKPQHSVSSLGIPMDAA
ncbi:UNVERIFIED_ORG: hypothetical protein GGD59_002252 [Rhizobium esperanzae]